MKNNNDLISIGSGRTREVFMSRSHPNLVIKVPVNSEGIQANCEERKRWVDNKDQSIEQDDGVKYYGPSYAQCWLRYYGDIPILYMERIKKELHFDHISNLLSSDGGYPKWGWVINIDCMQVGTSIIDGKVKAFDYA